MRTRLLVVSAAVCLAILTGCDFFKTDSSRWLDQTAMVKSPGHSPVMPINDALGPGDTTQELVPNSTVPREGDWEYTTSEYKVGPSDIVDITVLDLLETGVETLLRRQVSASGYIDLPLLRDRVKAEGLTTSQLKQVIADAYSPNVIKNATVSVMVVSERQNTFSVLGATARPGSYNLVRPDMRLLEAIALAGGITQTNIRYIYVIRPTPPKRVEAAAAPTARTVTPLPDLPPEAPDTRPAPTPSGTTGAVTGTTTGTATSSPSDNDIDAAMRELGGIVGGPTSRPASGPAPAVMHLTVNGGSGATAAPEGDQGIGEKKTHPWVYVNGKYVQVDVDSPVQTRPASPEDMAKGPSQNHAASGGQLDEDPFGWKRMDKSDMARIIAINLSRLQAGDPRMNIVIRDNDIIQIPLLDVGEFYVGGEVQRPGVYSLTGRRVTVKQAVIAAGNVGPMAWPTNSILIRRIGESQEQIFPLDIEGIFRGTEPDLFLKPDDVIAVGTDIRAPFLIVLRNAFRLTYGFGFIYDRNFADPFFGGLNSLRFSRW